MSKKRERNDRVPWMDRGNGNIGVITNLLGLDMTRQDQKHEFEGQATSTTRKNLIENHWQRQKLNNFSHTSPKKQKHKKNKKRFKMKSINTGSLNEKDDKIREKRDSNTIWRR